MAIINRVGPPVEGGDFFGREKELREANKKLDAGLSLLLSAPRRIGKSSFAKRLIEDKKSLGWKCVYVDLEEVRDENGFVQLIVNSFSDNQLLRKTDEGLSQGLSKALDKFKSISIGGIISLDIKDRDEQENLYGCLKNLMVHKEKTLVVMDELTLFLNVLRKTEGGEGKVSYILNWLRGFRQVSGTEIRWLFCGSVGLRNFTSMLNLSYTINDLDEFHIDALSETEAKGLLKGLSAGASIELNDDIIDLILGKLQWYIPYFIQVVFSKIVEEAETKVTPQIVDSAYDGLCSEKYLSTWSERLTEYGEYEMLARKLLALLCMNPAGFERENLLNDVMIGKNATEYDACSLALSKVLSMLENDGYILKKGPIRTFRSPLLRDYWYRKFIE